MSDLERAVYELAEVGALDASHAVLYARPIGKLARAGLLSRAADGSYLAVRARTDTRPPRSTMVPGSTFPVPQSVAPTPPPMGTLVVRVPQEWLDMLDAMGPDRSTALRTVLGRALASGSGMRPRVRDEAGRYVKAVGA